MARFETGDRVQVRWKGGSFVRDRDAGTVTAYAGDGLYWVLWDNPIHPHVDAKGWCAYHRDLSPEDGGWLARHAHQLVAAGAMGFSAALIALAARVALS